MYLDFYFEEQHKGLLCPVDLLPLDSYSPSFSFSLTDIMKWAKYFQRIMYNFITSAHSGPLPALCRGFTFKAAWPGFGQFYVESIITSDIWQTLCLFLSFQFALGTFLAVAFNTYIPCFYLCFSESLWNELWVFHNNSYITGRENPLQHRLRFCRYSKATSGCLMKDEL